jgi:shikimate dehydrogenase
MLRDHFGPRITVVDWTSASDAVSGAMTIVNATSLGMAGQPALSLELAAAPFDAVVTDIVYQPLMTPLLQRAQARGLVVVDGLGMLLHQAVPGFESWFHVRPEVDDALRAAVCAT